MDAPNNADHSPHHGTAKPCPDARQQPGSPSASRVLVADRKSFEAFLVMEMPRIQRRIRAAFARAGARASSPELAADASQEVLLALLAEGPQALRGFDSAHGASLECFVEMIAERRALSWRRSRRRGASTGDCLLDDDACMPCPVLVDDQADARRSLLRVGLQARQRLDERGRRLFEELLLRDTPVDDVCKEYGLTPNAVYSLRKRYRDLAYAAATARDPIPPRLAKVA